MAAIQALALSGAAIPGGSERRYAGAENKWWREITALRDITAAEGAVLFAVGQRWQPTP